MDRFDWAADGMEFNSRGDYVRYSDYKEEVDELKIEIQDLKDAIENAKSALNI
jgi:hypothetical protein